MTPPDPVKAVLTPGALGEALLHSPSQVLLEAWRDDRLRPIVCRSLLVQYFRLLRRLALPERLLRWWGYWLASAPKVQILNDPSEISSLPQLCLALAASGQASFVITGQLDRPVETAAPTEAQSPRWITIPQLVDLKVL